jgi:sialic acid synthase SpsE
MKIAGREVAPGAEPLVIAEIGVNHDGDAHRALQLADAAAAAGAGAVKVQFFVAELLLSCEAQLAGYQRNAGESDPFEMLRRLELSTDELASVARRARERGALAICTVFTPELVEDAERIGFDAYKVASPDVVNRPLIERLARTEKPLILSTGAATLSEVERTVGWLESARDRLALMHCVSSYPTPEAEANLGAIRTLGKEFSLPIGYSDHTEAIDTGALAVAAGACFLEKHLTYDRAASGPDHAASLEPDSLAEYVAGAQRAHLMLGGGEKRPGEIEADVRSLSRQSLAASRAIAAGETIAAAHVTTRRPGGALCASEPEAAIGRVASRDIEAGELLRASDVR